MLFRGKQQGDELGSSVDPNYDVVGSRRAEAFGPSTGFLSIICNNDNVSKFKSWMGTKKSGKGAAKKHGNGAPKKRGKSASVKLTGMTARQEITVNHLAVQDRPSLQDILAR